MRRISACSWTGSSPTPSSSHGRKRTMFLEQLAPGTPFQLPGGRKKGTLIYCGPGTARVKWGDGTPVTKTAMVRKKGIDPATGERYAPHEVTFTVPGECENIAPRTEVELVA